MIQLQTAKVWTITVREWRPCWRPSGRSRAKKVSRKNTIIFVSFDLEEYGLIGSEKFITTWLNPWLASNYGEDAQFVKPHGVIILDTMMEYNTSANSQDLPDDQIMEAFFPDAFENIESDGYRGDFLTLIYRTQTPANDKAGRRPDTYLAGNFSSYWKNTGTGTSKFQLESLPLPDVDVPAGSDLSNLLRSDHASFWDDNIPAIFITDSANFRGDMKVCYHHMCDDVATMLTDDNLDFLAKTADTIATTVNYMSEPFDDGTSGVQKTAVSWCLVAMATLFVGFLSLK